MKDLDKEQKMYDCIFIQQKSLRQCEELTGIPATTIQRYTKENGFYDKATRMYVFTGKKVNNITENKISYEEFQNLEKRIALLEDKNKQKEILNNISIEHEFSSASHFINVLIKRDIQIYNQTDKNERGGMLSARVRQSTKDRAELLARELEITTTKLLEFCIILGLEKLTEIENKE